MASTSLLHPHPTPGLAITIIIQRVTGHTLVQAAWTARAPDAPDVVGAVVNALEGAFSEQTAFDAAVAAAPPLDPASLGTPVATGVGKTGDIAIHCVALATAPPAVRSLHARLSSHLTFFIDGASPIDADDPDWDMLLAVHPLKGGAIALAGFATLFRMYGWPTATRLRVCQVSVLPPFLHRGIGWALLEAAYGVADARACLDVTVSWVERRVGKEGQRERDTTHTHTHTHLSSSPSVRRPHRRDAGHARTPGNPPRGGV